LSGSGRKKHKEGGESVPAPTPPVVKVTLPPAPVPESEFDEPEEVKVKKGRFRKREKVDISTLAVLSRVSRRPTGVIPLDIILGGGVDAGDMIEISSGPGVGKTTMLVTVMRNRCNAGGRVLYLDVERGLKDDTLKAIGVTAGSEPGQPFVVLSPIDYQQVEDVTSLFLEKGGVTDIVVDSATAIQVPSDRSRTISERVKQIGERSRYESVWLE